jgi:superfamily II DNA/RNA helicase
VHFDPPTDEKAYLHRSGRTARAGSVGSVVSLVEPSQRRDMQAMHRKAGVDPASHDVTPDHPEVVAIGNSGTPIPVVTLVPPVRSAGSPRNGGGRPARRPEGSARRPEDSARRPEDSARRPEGNGGRPRQPRRSMRAAG